MAKAGGKTSTQQWILLSAALALVAQFYGPTLARELLKRWLEEEKVRWRGLSKDGTTVEGYAEFWRLGPLVDWNESFARTQFLPGPRFYRIELLRVDVVALLPGKPVVGGAVNGFTPTKIWAAEEAKRMKGAGKIPEGIGISDFARELETRMAAAAKTDDPVRPVTWMHIKNHLREWGLWPINKI
jgi:hypothetical protein